MIHDPSRRPFREPIARARGALLAPKTVDRLRTQNGGTVDHPLPWLKLVDADNLDPLPIDFDGLNVEGPTGEHLGDVSGFVVNADGTRPYYVVVDAGGWFKSREYLLPVGTVRLDVEREVLVADLTRERIDRFPGFDRDQFEQLSADGLDRFNDETSHAVAHTEGTAPSAGGGRSALSSRPEFQQPDWWSSSAEVNGRDAPMRAASSPDAPPTVADLTRPVDRTPERDPSPHAGGRAQPGDILGVETGGERTQIGDTAEDEDARRRMAETRSGRDLATDRD